MRRMKWILRMWSALMFIIISPFVGLLLGIVITRILSLDSHMVNDIIIGIVSLGAFALAGVIIGAFVDKLQY